MGRRRRDETCRLLPRRDRAYSEIGVPRRSARSRLDHIRRRSDQKSLTARHTTDGLAPVGDPAGTITHKADAGRYDLIVMGSHGHTALGSLLLGSVAQRVLATCRVPVLIVR